MGIPTFDGVALFSRSADDCPGSVTARVHTETLPGVDGEFVHPHGSAGREITATGWLEATGATPSGAHLALKALLRARQGLVDGRTVATYVGTDAHGYDDCLLISYAPADAAQTSSGGGGYAAVMPVRAVLRQVAP